jgi:hypothetical protein
MTLDSYLGIYFSSCIVETKNHNVDGGLGSYLGTEMLPKIGGRTMLYLHCKTALSALSQNNCIFLQTKTKLNIQAAKSFV